ncbi:Hsp20/alpha crystallin family protein [Patescibacteria group bacterium]
MFDNDYLKNISEEAWFSHTEGQLSVDVIETPKTIIIRSAIAGVKPEDLDISVTEDTLTIRGQRHQCSNPNSDETIHLQECYWGAFSRSIVLPSHIKTDQVEAELKHGILTITLKKVVINKKIPIKVTE